MKNTLLLFLGVYVYSSLVFAEKRFDAAHSIALDAVITHATIVSEAVGTAGVEEEIKEQLSYLVGALNHYGGVLDLARTVIEVVDTKPISEPGFNRIGYTAKFHVSWPKGYSLPAKLSLPVPLRADGQGLNDFFAHYSRRCSENPNDPELGVSDFFYYFRPQKSGCNIQNGKDATYFKLEMTVSPENTNGKSPEYGKIWEDGEFSATMIIGTFESGAKSNGDIGIYQYNSIYTYLRKSFGNPLSMNVKLGAGANPGMNYPDIEMTFQLTRNRTFNVNLLLIDKSGLSYPTSAFLDRFNQRTMVSDFVSYSGHSGLGSNIRALGKMGKFEKGRYQLYYINGCDTFSYVDDDLSNAHMLVNPGESRYRYLDIISNSMPSPFSGFLQTNAAIIQSMLRSSGTYRDILSRFNSSQKAIVMGEEDNRWPLPFDVNP